MTFSIFPATHGDIILDLRQRDDGNVSVLVVDATGKPLDQGELERFVGGTGEAECHRKIISAEIPIARATTGHFDSWPG